MSFFKIDLQEDAWLDQVFQTRNKAYGAFQIRKSYSQNSLLGLGIALASFTMLLCLPLFLRAMSGEKTPIIIHDGPTLLRPFEIPDPIKPQIEIKHETQKQVRSTVQELPTKITPDDQVKQKKVIVSNQDIQGKDLGPTTTKGNDSAALVIIDKPKPGFGEEKPASDEIEISPEQGAEYPGGFGALGADVSQYLKGHYPQDAIDNGISGKVLLNFVVEKDGSIDLIQIIRGKELGGGIPEVAVKAVQHLKKFHPGKQNGHPVRQYFSFPITFELQNSDQ